MCELLRVFKSVCLYISDVPAVVVVGGKNEKANSSFFFVYFVCVIL